MKLYEQSSHLMPPRLRLVIDNAFKTPNRISAATVRFWLRRFEADARAVRGRVDARINKRRALYARRGVGIDSKGFITDDMRTELELAHTLDCGIEVARQAYQEILKLVDSDG